MVHRLYLFLLKRQVILALFLIASGWLVYQLRGIIASIFISYIIMAALHPAVEFLKKKGLPNTLAVLVPYASAILIFIVIIFPLIPFTVSQVQTLVTDLPFYADQAAKTFGFGIDAKAIEQAVTSEIGNISGNAVDVTSKVFGGVFLIITTLIVAFYLLLYQKEVKHFIADMFHKDEHEKVYLTLTQIDDKLGAWLRGQLILGIFIFLLTWVVLTILGVPFALSLAILAGLLEIIPTLGPTIAAIPAVIVALTVSPTLAIFVTAAYIIIQVIENNFLVPKIMQKAVGLNPVIVIIAVVIGANLMGFIGALLSIPFTVLMLMVLSAVKKEFDGN